MCGIVKEVGKLLGGGDTPQVLREAPATDAATTQAQADAKANADKLATRRRRKAASLLATGGQGDLSNPVTGTPTATAGKPTLGA